MPWSAGAAVSHQSSLKAEVRARALARRSAMPAAERAEAALRITQRLLAQADYHRAQTILVYATMRGEVDTAAICGHALAAGKTLAYPLVDWTDGTLHPVRLVNPARLTPGRWQLPEPPPEQREPVSLESIDLVLVPGVAFDLGGGRMGYGKGMFDRLLKALPAATLRWGLAYDLQVFDELPLEAHDQRVGAVLTESRLIVPGQACG